MPYLGPGATHPPLDVIADQQRHTQAVQAAETEDDYDQVRDEASSVGRGRWLVILLVTLGILGLVALLYAGLLFLLSP